MESAHESGLWRAANPFQIAESHCLISHRLMPALWVSVFMLRAFGSDSNGPHGTGQQNSCWYSAAWQAPAITGMENSVLKK